MSLVLSSVREDLTPAVFMDVENFFCKIQAVFLDWSPACPFLLEAFGLSAKEMLLKPGQFLNMRKAHELL